MSTSELLPSPSEVAQLHPVSSLACENVAARRRDVTAISLGRDPRFLLVVGPCSIHDETAALDYARHLAELAKRTAEHVVICMRVYLEKPRTCGGWKGFLHDPGLDGSLSVSEGLTRSRRLMASIAEMGLGIASELLDPLLAEYSSEFLSWAAIGARTSESQIHRELASSRPFPVGFKNATDGSTSGAVHAVVSAAQSHTRFSIDARGRGCVERSRGNPACHVVLRGGTSGPNYARPHVDAVSRELEKRDVTSRVVVDCSHGNSGKDPARQSDVFAELCHQLEQGAPLLGAMLESHLVAGKQELHAPAQLRYGQSITDACIDFAETARLVERLVEACERRSRTSGATRAVCSARTTDEVGQLQSLAAVTN